MKDPGSTLCNVSVQRGVAHSLSCCLIFPLLCSFQAGTERAACNQFPASSRLLLWRPLTWPTQADEDVRLGSHNSGKKAGHWLYSANAYVEMSMCQTQTLLWFLQLLRNCNFDTVVNCNVKICVPNGLRQALWRCHLTGGHHASQVENYWSITRWNQDVSWVFLTGSHTLAMTWMSVSKAIWSQGGWYTGSQWSLAEQWPCGTFLGHWGILFRQITGAQIFFLFASGLWHSFLCASPCEDVPALRGVQRREAIWDL